MLIGYETFTNDRYIFISLKSTERIYLNSIIETIPLNLYCNDKWYLTNHEVCT